ncbi:hypothetical protein ACFE04_014661 [Oxalis oulophora]
MAGHFNEKSSIPGHIPLGSFNAMFNFTGSAKNDIAATKSLAMVGYFIPLYHVTLQRANVKDKLSVLFHARGILQHWRGRIGDVQAGGVQDGGAQAGGVQAGDLQAVGVQDGVV